MIAVTSAATPNTLGRPRPHPPATRPLPARRLRAAAVHPRRPAGAGWGIRVWCMASGSLVVKATAGKNDPERCNQAFTVAATAAASGVAVSLWLTGDATLLALPGQADDFRLAYAAPLAALPETVLKAGSGTVCTQRAARREIPEDAPGGGRGTAGSPRC